MRGSKLSTPFSPTAAMVAKINSHQAAWRYSSAKPWPAAI